jgi:hypothetical protein
VVGEAIFGVDEVRGGSRSACNGEEPRWCLEFVGGLLRARMKGVGVEWRWRGEVLLVRPFYRSGLAR